MYINSIMLPFPFLLPLHIWRWLNSKLVIFPFFIRSKNAVLNKINKRSIACIFNFRITVLKSEWNFIFYENCIAFPFHVYIYKVWQAAFFLHFSWFSDTDTAISYTASFYVCHFSRWIELSIKLASNKQTDRYQMGDFFHLQKGNI